MTYYMFNTLGMFEVTRESLTDQKHRLGTVAYNSETRVWIQLGLVSEHSSKPKNKRWLIMPAENIPSEYRAMILLLP